MTVAYPPAAATTALLGLSSATALRTSPCVVVSVSVISAGTVGALYDAAATGTATTGKAIAVIPATVGVYPMHWPCATGVVVAPGASQVIAISLA